MQDAGAPEREAADVDLLAGLATAEPRETGRAALGDERGGAAAHLGLELRGVEVLGRRQRDRLGAPCHRIGRQRLALRRRPGALHAVREPLGEHETVGWRTVVVLPRADVAAGPVEVDVQRARDGELAHEARDAGKIRVRDAGAVIALRMRGVIAQHGDRSFPVPETHQRDLRIDRALRFRPERRVGGRGVAHGADLAVGPEDAAVRRDLVHGRRPEAEVRHRHRALRCPAHRDIEPAEDLALEAALEVQRVDAAVLQDLLRAEVAVRRVVLVQRVDGHAVGRGARGLGQGPAERVVALVGDAEPIHRAEDDRAAGAEQHDAARAQAEVPGVGDRIVGHAAADRRRGVDIERGELERVGP